MMDWGTIAMLAGFVVFYAIGKGIGRAEGRDEAKAMHVILKINGDPIGGFGIVGMDIGVPTRDDNT